MTPIELYYKSSVIVIARAGETTDVADARGGEPDCQTPLLVIRKLRGPADLPREIIVGTVARAGCPYDAHFPKDGIYLVFLGPWKPEHFYRTIDLGNSARRLEEDGVQAYAHQYAELARVVRQTDQATRNAGFIRFYVDGLFHPATRSDGLQGVFAWTRAEGPTVVTDAERRQLCDVLLRERPLQYASYELASWLADFPDARLDDYFLESLYRADEPNWSHIAELAVRHLPGRLEFNVAPDWRTRLDDLLDRTREAQLYDDRRALLRLNVERRVLAETFRPLAEAAKRRQAKGG